jgi:hypothetical protein
VLVTETVVGRERPASAAEHASRGRKHNCPRAPTRPRHGSSQSSSRMR